MYCSPETCRSGTCNLEQREQLSKRAPPEPVSLPPISDWFSADNYGGDSRALIRGGKPKTEPSSTKLIAHVLIQVAEVSRAYSSLRGSIGVGPNVLGIYKSTSAWVEFGQNPATVAVKGLYGCTGVAVVNRRGAWLAHFWEHVPGSESKIIPETWRRNEDPEEHKDNPRDEIRYNRKGLEQMIQDGIFVNDVEIWVFHPRPRENADGSLNMDENEGPETNGDAEVFKEVITKLKDLFPNIEPQLKRYSPLLEVNGVGYESGRPDPRPDNEFLTHRGKFLIQYQPATKKCSGGEKDERAVAQYRVWKESTSKFFIPNEPDID